MMDAMNFHVHVVSPAEVQEETQCRCWLVGFEDVICFFVCVLCLMVALWEEMGIYDIEAILI